MPKSNYSQANVLNIVRGVAPPVPTTVYYALYTVAPTESGGGTEVGTIGTAYARQPVTFGAPVADSPNGYKSSNTADVTFPVATATWGTIVAFAIHDQVTGGNMLYTDALSTVYTVIATNQVITQAGTLVLREK